MLYAIVVATYNNRGLLKPVCGQDPEELFSGMSLKYELVSTSKLKTSSNISVKASSTATSSQRTKIF